MLAITEAVPSPRAFRSVAASGHVAGYAAGATRVWQPSHRTRQMRMRTQFPSTHI